MNQVVGATWPHPFQMLLERRYLAQSCAHPTCLNDGDWWCPNCFPIQPWSGAWWVLRRVHDKILRSGGQSEGIVESGLIIEPVFPERIEAMAGMNTAQEEDVIGSRHAPEHARLLVRGANDGFAVLLGHYPVRVSLVPNLSLCASPRPSPSHKVATIVFKHHHTTTCNGGVGQGTRFSPLRASLEFIGGGSNRPERVAREDRGGEKPPGLGSKELWDHAMLFQTSCRIILRRASGAFSPNCANGRSLELCFCMPSILGCRRQNPRTSGEQRGAFRTRRGRYDHVAAPNKGDV